MQLIRSQPQKINPRKNFEQAVKEALAHIKKEDQTKKKMLQAVKNVAFEHGVGSSKLLQALDAIRLPNGEPLVYQPAHKLKDHSQRKAAPKQQRQSVTKPSQSAQTASPHETKKQDPSEKKSTPKTESAKAHEQESKTNANAEAARQESEHKTNSGRREQTGRAKTQTENLGSDRTSKNHKSSDSQDHAKKQKVKSGKSSEPSIEQQVRNLEFTRRYGESVDRLWAERQTRDKLRRIAHVLARRYKADEETLNRTLKEMRPGAERSFVHVKSPRVFANSPLESLKWMRVPKIAVGDKQPKWNDILWKKNLPLVELRLQKKRLFTNAPKWSPLHGLEIPALRFCAKKPDSEKSQEAKRSVERTKSESKKKKKDKSQSH